MKIRLLHDMPDLRLKKGRIGELIKSDHNVHVVMFGIRKVGLITGEFEEVKE